MIGGKKMDTKIVFMIICLFLLVFSVLIICMFD